MSTEKQFNKSIYILAIGLLFESFILAFHIYSGLFLPFQSLYFYIPIPLGMTFIVGIFPFSISIINMFLTIICMIFAFQMGKNEIIRERKCFIKNFILGSSLTIVLPFFKTSVYNTLFLSSGGGVSFRTAIILNYSIWIGILLVYCIGFHFLRKSWDIYSQIYQNNPKIRKIARYLKICYIISIIFTLITIILASFDLYVAITSLELPEILYMLFGIPSAGALIIINLSVGIGYHMIGKPGKVPMILPKEVDT